MKINDILYDMILEEFGNKKILKMCMTKWYGENPTNEQTFEADDLLTKFYELKTNNKLKTTNAEVITFLNNFPDFDSSNIPNASFYSLQQMKFIVGEFYELNGENDMDNGIPEILRGTNLPKTPERIEASKSLWYGDNQYTIINEDGFRVYSIPDRQTSINFGYYEGSVSQTSPYKEQPYHMQWCTTREMTSSNLYSSYRDRRTFYFVIDESKHPDVEPNVQISQYYLSALQYSTDNGVHNFRITSILNSGSDPILTEDEIYSIYPKLRGHMDKIKKVEYDPKSELGDDANILDMINENGGPYDFSKMSWRLKKAYIDRVKPIRKEKSWLSMQDGLKTSYIDLTEKSTVYERFKKELFFTIKKEKKWLTSLERRLTILGYKGLSELVAEINKDTYDLIRVSRNSNDVVLYRTKTKPSKYGIWNSKNNDWQEQGGITYNDNYTDPTPSVFKSSKDDKRYFVQIFNTSGQPDNRSFVILYPTTQEDKAMGYFMTYDKFLELKENERLYKEGQTDIDVDIEKHSDIKEWN